MTHYFNNLYVEKLTLIRLFELDKVQTYKQCIRVYRRESQNFVFFNLFDSCRHCIRISYLCIASNSSVVPICIYVLFYTMYLPQNLYHITSDYSVSDFLGLRWFSGIVHMKTSIFHLSVLVSLIVYQIISCKRIFGASCSEYC